MYIFPAIDLFAGQAVRLYQGDYNQMTVYEKEPLSLIDRFIQAGAGHLHMVDLEGARMGGTPNLELITAAAQIPGLFLQVGGGIRSLEVMEKYLSAGVDRVILGTAALRQPDLVAEAVSSFGSKIAVGVDMKDGKVAVNGWTEVSEQDGLSFCRSMESMGVSTLICTDISRDGAMRGCNRQLYQQLQQELGLNIVASGGVSTLDDVAALAELGLYGAIIGKAYYTGDIRLEDAVKIGEKA